MKPPGGVNIVNHSGANLAPLSPPIPLVPLEGLSRNSQRNSCQRGRGAGPGWLAACPPSDGGGWEGELFAE